MLQGGYIMKVKLKFYYKNTHEAGYKVGFHNHNCYEIIHYNDATGFTVIGGTEYKIKPNCLAVIPPKVLHNEEHYTDGYLSYIGLETDYPLKTGMYYSPENTEVLKTFRHIISELLDKPSEYELMAQSLATQLVIALGRFANAANANNSNNIKFSIEFIKENYSGKINFSDLARMNNYSDNYFRRVFKKTTSMSPQRFLTVTRLNNVRNFLENSKLNITEISYRCGFSNSVQLSAMFKTEYGVTPTEYRKKYILKE